MHYKNEPLESKLESQESIVEKFAEQPNERLDTTDMPELESEEFDGEGINQVKSLKIRTPNQMHSRLPISVAQLKVGNNSKKLKNEIRQILYSLYRSKKLIYRKQIYKSLIVNI